MLIMSIKLNKTKVCRMESRNSVLCLHNSFRLRLVHLEENQPIESMEMDVLNGTCLLAQHITLGLAFQT